MKWGVVWMVIFVNENKNCIGLQKLPSKKKKIFSVKTFLLIFYNVSISGNNDIFVSIPSGMCLRCVLE